MLKVHEIFKSIQCEGPFTGTPALFIRLYGCSAGCPWCDTPQGEVYEVMSERDIMESLYQLSNCPMLVVITGGEPMEQDITLLISMLIKSNCQVQVETNGHQPVRITHKMLFYVCSPKQRLKVDVSVLRSAVALKYTVLYGNIDPMDGLPIDTDKPLTEDSIVYLSPCNNKGLKKNTELAVHLCITHNYILNTQIHKLIGIR